MLDEQVKILIFNESNLIIDKNTQELKDFGFLDTGS